MKTAILTFWLISLGVVGAIVSIEDTWDFKEKVKILGGIMGTITIAIVGTVLMVGV